MDLVSRLRYSLEGRPEWWPPAPLVNPSNGNVVLQIWPPLGGPADPRVVLTYNSWSPEESEYGYGWSNSLNRWVAGGNIVHAGDGAIFYYESANYTPPAGAQNTLVCHEDYSGVETQPDGFQMHYETTGKLTKFESAAGDVWTLVGFGGDRVYAVIDPFNRRTSIVYGGSDKIQRVVDAYGRITTFTVDGSGDLVKMTTPELCETEFRYDANHQLTAYIDPEGSRTTFSYEGVNHWVRVDPDARRPEGHLPLGRVAQDADHRPFGQHNQVDVQLVPQHYRDRRPPGPGDDLRLVRRSAAGLPGPQGRPHHGLACRDGQWAQAAPRNPIPGRRPVLLRVRRQQPP